jgi:hypothetical protein
MRPGVIVGIVCVAILLGAGVWSRRLVDEVTPPPGNLPSSSPVFAQPAPPPPPPPPTTARPPPPPLQPQQPAGTPPPPPVAVAPPLAAAAPSLAPPVDEEVPAAPPADAFRGDSRELQYAERLVMERKPTAERLKSAIEVLERCRQFDPKNERCENDLELARKRLEVLESSPASKPLMNLDDVRAPSRPWLTPLTK